MTNYTLSINLFLFVLLSFSCSDQKKERHNRQVGLYCIDLEDSDPNIQSYSDLPIEELTLEFKSDGTFEFNFSVPFIRDSTGTWKVGDDNLYEWNYMHYKNQLNTTGDQVSTCCDNDSSIIINSLTPKPEILRSREKVVNYLSFERCQN